MDANHGDLRSREPDPSPWQHDIPIRLRKHSRKRRKLETDAHTFFLGGILSFPLSTPFYPPDTISVGASAAIFTLTAVVVLLKPLRFSWLLLMPQGLVAVLYFLYNALAVYYHVQGDVAYVAHVIGFSIGLPLGIAWSTQWKRNLLISIGLLFVYGILLYLLTTYILPSLGKR